MNPQDKKISCVACKAYLFEDDDVVHCPVCGAPHHRDCYNAIGHCAVEELHGTADEYDADKISQENNESTNQNGWERIQDDHTVTCKICGNEYDSDQGKCPNCSAPDFGRMGGGYAQFDFLGGVPADYEIEDGVTAEDAKKFVLSNTHRYIPKFVSLNKKRRVSWNWVAFLLPAPWMFSRKMYSAGIVTTLLTLIATFLAYPLSAALIGLGFPETQSYTELLSWMMDKIPEIAPQIIIVAFIGSVMSIIISIICGMYGDYIYKKHTVSTIKDIKSNSEDKDTDYRKKGGVNFILFFISYMLIQYVPQIVVSFF